MMMPAPRYCTVARCGAAGACRALAAAQAAGRRRRRDRATPRSPIFVRGVEIGRDAGQPSRDRHGWVITSTGRFGDVVLNRFELKYDADWQPIELRIEATQAQRQRRHRDVVRR